MKDPEVIPELPRITREDPVIEKEAVELFVKSDCGFIFVDTPNGQSSFFFKASHDVRLYSALVAKLCSPENKETFELLKLSLESARLIKQGTKKGKQGAMRVEDYLKKRLYDRVYGIDIANLDEQQMEAKDKI